MSLLCHGLVLIPLASLPAWSDTPPRYSVQRGGAAAPSLRASLAAPEEASELEETQAVVTSLPSYEQTIPASPPQPEPNLTVLPETTVLARVASRVATQKPEPLPTLSPPTLPPPMPATVAHSEKPSKVETPASPSRRAPLTARRGTPARYVGSGKPGSTGADAMTVAGSVGSAGGGQVDQGPSLDASNPAPPYPADAFARGVGGLVLLRVRIAADGSVEKATIATSSGVPSLDESALSTVRRYWHFVPATRGGIAVSHDAEVPIRFTFRAD